MRSQWRGQWRWHGLPGLRVCALPLFLLAARFASELLPLPRAPHSPPASSLPPLRSLSVGRTNSGRLINGRKLPPKGYGYFHIQPERGLVYGTDQLIGGLVSVAARLRQSDPLMPPLAIGNLSSAKGGHVAQHKSHQNGRDADLGFFLINAAGRPLSSRRFVICDAAGRGRLNGRPVFFDSTRNWALVKTLLTSPRFGSDVRFIFVSNKIKTRLLSYAARQGESQALLHRAAAIMRQPKDDPHAQHFHVRIGCSRDDLLGGCRDL